MKRFHLLVLTVVGFLSTGANGGGCGTEYSPGDGSSGAWTTGSVPVPESTPRPMTDLWLAEDNCWKRLVAKAEKCAATTGVGDFDDERRVCSFASGGELELSGPVSAPASGTTLFPIVNWRVLGPSGERCVTGKILEAGRTILDVQGEAALLESTSLTAYRVTCPDGKTYASDAPGTSSTFGSTWLAKKAPGVLFFCNGTSKTCELELWGGPAGQANLAVCK